MDCAHLRSRCNSLASTRRTALVLPNIRARAARSYVAHAQASAVQPPAEVLKSWVLATGVAMPADLKPAQGAGGYGMVCLAPVAEGQDLVCIPRKLLMSVETARQAPEYGQLVRDTGLTEWQSLILHLLCERAKAQDSFWAPYIAMLPDQAHHPLMWGPERLAWLQGSPLVGVLTQRQAQVREDTEALMIAGANDDVAWGEGGHPRGQEPLVTEASVRWAACTLLSRAFSLDMHPPGDQQGEGEEGEEGAAAAGTARLGIKGSDGDQAGVSGRQGQSQDVLALVPWADMLCHSSEAGPESCLRYCSETNAVRLSAHTSYSPGQEVFDSYGPSLSPGELLLDYGFVDACNTQHKVEVDPRDVASPSSGRPRTLLGALAAVQGEDVRMALSPRGPDLTFLTWLRATVATDAQLIRAGWRVKASERDVELACRVMGSLSEPLNLENESKVLSSIVTFIDRKLQSYPSTLEQDQEEERHLAQAQDQEQWLRCQVLRALISEKLSLHGCREVVVGWQQRLQEGTPVTELYADWDWGYGGAQEEGWDDEDEEGEAWP